MLPRTLESSVLDGDLRIGDFVVRPLLKAIRPVADDAAGEETTLPDKAMAVLVFLAQHARQVCDREDILDAVWGPEREAYDRVLDNAIREIRRALKDDARNPKYIQTIPKKGYRLLVPVESRLLEKQRDSSGEFVPVTEASAQVFQRVRRGSKPAAPTHSNLDVRSAGSHERSVRPKPPAASRGRTALGIAAALLLLVTAAAWNSGIFTADGVSIAIDAGNIDSGRTAAGDQSTPPASEIVEALRDALFEKHACGEIALFRPDSWLRATDYEIRLGYGEKTSPHPITAEITPTRRRAIVLPDPDWNATASSLARETTEQLDQAVCELDRLPDKSRACHCLEGSRRWAALPDSQVSVEYLEQAIALDPELIPAYAALADAFRAIGDYESGMAVLKTGLARIGDPDATEALRLRLQLVRLLGDYSEEERLLERLRDRDPDDIGLRLAQAGFLTQHRRQCERSLEILEPLEEREHHSVAFVAEMSRALWLCGRYEETVEIVENRVESLPRQGELRGWLAMILSLVGQYEDAVHYATESIAIDPEQSEPYWTLGVVSSRQGHYSAAQAWHEKARDLAMSPKQTALSEISLIRLAWLQGQTARCLEMASAVQVPYQEASEPVEPPALLKGLCLADAGRTKEAAQTLRDYTASLAGQSSSVHVPLTLLLRAQIAMAEAETSEQRQHAASLFVEAASARPLRVDLFYSETGAAMLKAGDPESAEAWFRKALAVNPNHPWTLCRLGMLDKDRGEHERAAESMRRGLRVFGPRLEDPLAGECAAALRAIDPEWNAGSGDTDRTS